MVGCVVVVWGASMGAPAGVLTGGQRGAAAGACVGCQCHCTADPPRPRPAHAHAHTTQVRLVVDDSFNLFVDATDATFSTTNATRAEGCGESAAPGAGAAHHGMVGRRGGGGGGARRTRLAAPAETPRVRTRGGRPPLPPPRRRWRRLLLVCSLRPGGVVHYRGESGCAPTAPHRAGQVAGDWMRECARLPTHQHTNTPTHPPASTLNHPADVIVCSTAGTAARGWTCPTHHLRVRASSRAS